MKFILGMHFSPPFSSLSNRLICSSRALYKCSPLCVLCFLFFFLNSSIQHSYFEIHPCWMLLCQWFIPFYCCSSLSSMEILPAVYPSVDGYLGCLYTKSCCEHSRSSLYMDLCFHFSWVNTLVWNDWDIRWVYIWLSKELSNCFPKWFYHFTFLQSVYLSSSSF